ncbi:MAG: hypothetical protein QG639_501, partial [Patescibacteria group bacterium]|nr:hypothetical protein [Patescibacteria group bacterium]
FEQSGRLQAVSFRQLAESIPVELVLVRSGEVIEVTVNYLFPEVFINDKSVYSYYPSVLVGSFPYEENQRIAINQFEMSNGKGVFNLGKNNSIQVVSPTDGVIFNWNSDTSAAHQEIIEEKLNIPLEMGTKKLTILHHLTPEYDSHSYSLAANFKSLVPRKCTDGSLDTRAEIAREKDGTQYFQLQDEKSSTCVTIDMTYLEPESSFLIEATTQHVKGNPLVLNITSAEGVFLASTAMSTSPEVSAQYFVVPTTTSKFAYRMQLENGSLNKLSSNRIYDVNFLNIPYNLLKDLKISSLSSIPTESQSWDFIQLNETQYLVTVPSATDADQRYIVLNQAYDKGWIAFPRMSPWKLLPHTKFNGWGNAWLVPANASQVTVIFWPELLVLTGYSFLIVTSFWLWKKSR